MPEGRITSIKIRDHFRRMWIFYLVGMAIVLFLNNLIFTVTRPSFSDDETLKIMLLNVEAQIDESALLASLQDAGIRCVETEALAGAAADDPTSNMLLLVKLTSGFGDIYITDSAGLAQLESRAACLDLSDVQAQGAAPVFVTHPETNQSYAGALQLADGRYLVVPSNSTNIPQARQALPTLIKMLTE